MATRINTKFVITLASIVVLLVLSMVFAFTFLKKSAADHVRLAEEAMQRAEIALADGDIKAHNTERERAAKHFGNAKSKDATNAEYLYGFIEAHQKYICDNLTAASNQLDSILAGAASIHDTPGASEEDRALLYEMLHERARKQLMSGKQHPIGMMFGYTTKRLDVDPQDPVATRYRAISLSFMADDKTDEEEVAKDIQFIADAAGANPNNPWLQSAAARYHMGNARRLFRAKGNTITDEVNAGFALAFKHAEAALQLAEQEMPAYVEAAGILADLRSGDEAVTAQINQRQREIAKQLSDKLQDKKNRDALFVEEVDRAIAILKLARPNAEDEANTIDGPAQALALAKSLAKERPNEPAAYQILGNLQRETNRFEEAESSIEAGLAIERLANAGQFMRDNRARLGMQGMLADIKCTLAVRSSDAKQREAMLKEADAIIDEMALADTMQTQWREARVDYLRGRVFLAQNKPRQAVTFLERANQAYGNKDAQTLRLLAQTHTRLGNDKLVAGFYETIVTTLRATQEDLLNLINLYINPGEGQQLDRAQAQLDRYRQVIPGDMRAIRLQARLLAAQGKADEAIALLQEQDLDKNPELVDMIAALDVAGGNRDGMIKLLRERIADRPAGEDMNLQLVTRLLNLMPDTEQKKAELQRLAGEGLDEKIVGVLTRVLTTGQSTLEDQLALIDIQGGSPADIAMNKFLLYQRNNQPEEAQPYLDKAIELEPNRADVIEWRFRLALGDKRWSDAQQAIKDMLKLSPDKRSEVAVADGRFMRAQVLAVRASAMDLGEPRTKRIREAIVAYNNALGEYSHYVDGWVQLGRLHFMQGNYYAAQDGLREALKRQSNNLDALELMGLSEQASGDQINALERFEQILTIQPNHPTALDRFTALAQQMNLVARAIELREQIRERAPTNYNNRRVLALLYAQDESHTKAKQAIQDVITAQGSTRQNMVTLSQVLGANDAHEQAIKAIQDYLTKLGDKVQWRDHLLLAQVFEQADKTAEADAAFTKAIALEKPEGTFGASLAQAQALMGRGKTAEAAAIFEDLAKQFPDNHAIKQQAAELHLRLGNFDKAEAFANSLPDSAQRYQLLIQSASAQEGKFGVAIKRAQQGVGAYPSDFGLRLSLVELLRTEQDRKAQDQRVYSKLLSMAKALAKDHPDRVEAKVVLADVLLRMDRLAQATATLEEALELAPRHLATNERLFGIRLREARGLAPNDVEASREKAREALAIISILLENRPNVPVLLRSAGQAAQLAGLTAVAVDYYAKTFEATQEASDLAAYATALLAAGRGAQARVALEGDNATLVSNSLFLRALRGRAIAAAGQPDTASRLFGNLLTQAKEPGDQLLITQQIILAFNDDPDRAVKLIEDTLGKDLPVNIDTALASLLLRQLQYEQAAARLIKYVKEPTEDVGTQFMILTQLALAHQESGQLIEAKAIYEMVFEKLEKNKTLIPQQQQVQMLNNMAYLLADQLQGYEKDAVRYAKRALDLLTDNVSDREHALIQDTLGWAYFKAGQNDDAIHVLKKSVAKYPLVANQLHLGRAYLASGDENDKNLALLILEKAVNQAKSEGDEKMIAKTQKWYREAL